MEDWRKNLYRNYSTNKGRANQNTKRNCAFFKDKIQGLLPTDKTISIVDLAAGHGALLQCLKERGYHNIKGIEVSPKKRLERYYKVLFVAFVNFSLKIHLDIRNRDKKACFIAKYFN